MLSIENLNVEYYRRGQVIQAVRDFSLTINDGETVGLIGESGSGKSTVALAILRLFRAQEGRITSGKIIFDGIDLLALLENDMRDVRGRRISMIFQDPFTSLNPVMRVREQLAEIVGAGPRARPQWSDTRFNHDRGQARGPAPTLSDALERVHLDPARVLNSYPHQLSGGQRQRVMIAMALIGKPSLILADEPTTALDVLVQKDILDLLFTLQRDLNVSMLFITHNLALVAERAKRIAVMKEGHLVEESSAAELFQNPQQDYTRALLQSIPQLPR